MFWRKYKIINDEAFNKLEKRICDIENPFKFQIKDKITYNDCDGLIVDRKLTYCTKYKDLLLSESTFITNYPLKFYETKGNLIRENKYLILLDVFSYPFWIEENQINLKNKQK